jgi:glyoxylase-like metal-dependent hydrolase (beta-lactamase superfamily II)
MEKSRSRPNVFSRIVLSGLAPLKNREVLPGGVVRIVDGHSSFFVVPVGNHKYVLIDAGVDKKAIELQQYMYENDILEEDIVGGLITHGHSDHIGGFHVFNRMPIHVGREDSDVIRGNKRSQGLLPRAIDYLPNHRGAKIPGLEPKIISDNQIISYGDVAFRGYAVAGHTDGSFAYSLEGVLEPILFPGDVIVHKKDGSIGLPPRLVTADTKANETAVINLTRRVSESNFPPLIVAPSHSGVGDFDAMKRFGNFATTNTIAN